MKKEETTNLLAFWQGKQPSMLPRDVFQFSHYLGAGWRKQLIPAEYPMVMFRSDAIGPPARRKGKQGARKTKGRATAAVSEPVMRAAASAAVSEAPRLQAAPNIPAVIQPEAGEPARTRMEVLLTPRRLLRPTIAPLITPLRDATGNRPVPGNSTHAPGRQRRPPPSRGPVAPLAPETPTQCLGEPTRPNITSRPRPRPKVKGAGDSRREVDNSDELFIRRRRQ